MDEYIERKAAHDAVVDAIWHGKRSMYSVANSINSVPSADVAPVRHGRCKKSDGKDEWYTYYYTCVECGANMMVADADYHDVSPNYCPICAARMDLGVVT